MILRRDFDKDVFYGESLRRDLLPSALLEMCVESSYRELVQIYFAKTLLQRSCQHSSYRELALRSLEEYSQETSYLDVVQRTCQDTSFGDLAQRHL